MNTKMDTLEELSLSVRTRLDDVRTDFDMAMEDFIVITILQPYGSLGVSVTIKSPLNLKTASDIHLHVLDAMQDYQSDGVVFSVSFVP